jgi:hypothetical protein
LGPCMERAAERQASGLPHSLLRKPPALAGGVFTEPQVDPRRDRAANTEAVAGTPRSVITARLPVCTQG